MGLVPAAFHYTCYIVNGLVLGMPMVQHFIFCLKNSSSDKVCDFMKQTPVASHMASNTFVMSSVTSGNESSVPNVNNIRKKRLAAYFDML